RFLPRGPHRALYPERGADAPRLRPRRPGRRRLAALVRPPATGHRTMTGSNRNARGFTLLEIAVATAALGVALSAAMYIVVGVSSSAEHVRRVGDTQDVARLALDALAAEIRMSGAGASSGQIGIGTTAGAVARVPAI